ncbi:MULTISPECIES: hypothetical protein [unclassified Streptomyces]|uniref:hypothetical protein n=1 Tax=unclassified Streptomyces TaxID=2593676 RepID=UPI00324F6BB8
MRRSYNCDRGDGDSGLIFSCFQRDLAKRFEAAQRRLEGEAMAKYILTTGGGTSSCRHPGTPGSTRCSVSRPGTRRRSGRVARRPSGRPPVPGTGR